MLPPFPPPCRVPTALGATQGLPGATSDDQAHDDKASEVFSLLDALEGAFATSRSREVRAKALETMQARDTLERRARSGLKAIDFFSFEFSYIIRVRHFLVSFLSWVTLRSDIQVCVCVCVCANCSNTVRGHLTMLLRAYAHTARVMLVHTRFRPASLEHSEELTLFSNPRWQERHRNVLIGQYYDRAYTCLVALVVCAVRVHRAFCVYEEFACWKTS